MSNINKLNFNKMISLFTKNELHLQFIYFFTVFLFLDWNNMRKTGMEKKLYFVQFKCSYKVHIKICFPELRCVLIFHQISISHLVFDSLFIIIWGGSIQLYLLLHLSVHSNAAKSIVYVEHERFRFGDSILSKFTSMTNVYNILV